MFAIIIIIITIIGNSSRVVMADSYRPNLNPVSLIFHSVKWDTNLSHKAVILILFWKPNDGICQGTS